MHTERKVIKKHPKELFMFDTFFKKLTGIDLEDIPEKYEGYVLDAQKIIKDNTEIIVMFKCDNIQSMTEDSVILENGVCYTSKMIPRILKDAKQVVTCLITLHGFEELRGKTDDVMEEYFLDAWGSTYVESAQAWLANYIQCELESEGMKRTHLWSPGQHSFELHNQRAVFDILQPDEDVCTLTSGYMMVPLKSGSGIWGVVDMDTKDLLLPCDFCQFKEKCPSSKVGCAET